MEQKSTIFDTVVIGAVAVLWFAMEFHFVVNPACFNQKIDALINFVTIKTDDLTGKLLIIGISGHVLGAIIQIASICLFPRPWKGDPARECLQNRIVHWIDKYNKGKNRENWI